MHEPFRRWLDTRAAGPQGTKMRPAGFKKALFATLTAGVMALPHEGRAACSRLRDARVRVSTEVAKISVKADFSIADLARMADTVSQAPSHRVLGFYASAIGFKLHMPTPDAASCAGLIVEVQLVMTQRVIELARDIDRCLFDAALKHYRHHADLQTQALEQSGDALRLALRQFAANALSSDEDLKFGAGTPFDGRTRVFVTQWLDGLRAAAPSLQAAADSVEELQALRQACAV